MKDNISIARNKIPHFAHTTFQHIELLMTSISMHIRLVVVYRPPQSNINKNTKVKFLRSLVICGEVVGMQRLTVILWIFQH